ncbi:hypothetical protein [Rheinheimera sp.]|uniref:hypothetical protein n=1 Tax=Rheinheimera sp. TaxID=1869214 RepID=UPI00307DF05F
MPTLSFGVMRLVLLVLVFSTAVSAQQWLETQSYWIRLDSDCPVLQDCASIRYQGHSKITGATISLEGRPWWVGNKQRPLFWGYRFYSGRLHYVLHRQGLLQVTNRKGHVLVEEQGLWLQQAPDPSVLPLQQ